MSEALGKIVPAEVVGKYYIKAEFDRFLQNPAARLSTEATIDSLSQQDFWRMLNAMSFTFRMNALFWMISDTSYSWQEEKIPAQQIELLEMSPKVDAVTFSSTIGRDPVKFSGYLQDYFVKHPYVEDDPEGLGQFRPNNREIVYPKLISVERDNKIKLVDGGNRLMAMLQRGQDEVTSFVGRKANLEGRPMLGDSVFLLLKGAYEKAAPEDRPAILRTVRLLMGQSRDGVDAVQSYWIDHVKDLGQRKIGEGLLRSDPA